nr:recombinase family protein [Micromonospora sp. MW-13]
MGYARVSTGGQKLERQLDALKATGCRRIFAEKQSGRDTDRPELTACLAFLAGGDTLVVPSLDRLSRSLSDLITTVGELRRRDVGFTSLHENLDTTTPGGRLVFHVFAALAEFIRELIGAVSLTALSHIRDAVGDLGRVAGVGRVAARAEGSSVLG